MWVARRARWRSVGSGEEERVHIGELADLAEEHGIRVVWHRGGPKGAWLPPGTVSVREGMSGAQTRCTLAHELAHALAGDPAG